MVLLMDYKVKHTTICSGLQITLILSYFQTQLVKSQLKNKLSL